jgi:hypothetical protein
MRSALFAFALASSSALVLTGCEASCKTACKALLECEDVDTPRLPLQECEASCLVQQDVYDSWEDTQLSEAFGEFKSCVRDEECAAIADGACYQEDLFLW